MGHRILVAFLALLASLAAQIAPASARACERGPAEVGACQVQASALSFAETETAACNDAAASARPRLAAVPMPNEQFLAAPAVRTGVDRALE